MTPPFVELDLQLLNISIANTKYKKMDLFPFNFYSLTNIANVAVQVIANAQKDRKSYFLSFVKLTHCSGRDADIPF
jgi:alpha-N-acetylglucosamine transferase